MTHSIRARFGFSLFANLSKSVITFGTGMLVARGLGPEQYGKMMFLLGTFTATRQLLDMGSSQAFFTFLSQRERSRRFVGWYFVWLGLQFSLTLIAVGLLFPAAWIELIWRGEQRSLIVLAFLAAFMQSVIVSVVMQLCESQRLTRRIQGAAVSVAFVHFLLMALAWWWGWLSIMTIFILIISEWIIAVAVIVKPLSFPHLSGKADTAKSVFFEFWYYCRPLIPYSWLGFLYEFADRWLMQKYAGGVDQAYYSVAYQFSAIAGIATSSILNVFWKEIAEAQHQNSRERIAILYRRVSRGLFFVAAAAAGFLAPWAEDILRITLGTTYIGGASTLTLMFFYPLHQSMGQIGGALAYATEQVAAYVKIGMVFMALSIVVSYFVLADTEALLPGLSLGSLGLASKMVLMQIFSVNALAHYLSRSLGIEFDWVSQPAAALTCLAAGFLAYAISHTIFDESAQLWFALLISGLVYAMLILVLIGLAPGIAGLCRADLAAAVVAGSRWVCYCSGR